MFAERSNQRSAWKQKGKKIVAFKTSTDVIVALIVCPHTKSARVTLVEVCANAPPCTDFNPNAVAQLA